ncbi:MAG: enoyl-CoA hydratase-related protein [Gammaproteobacteria bacterium]|nr:enoyl-CoA hydratase-related protein [Gammaproteobacteria bacterium]MDH5273440.1 enoyl-CoA hydratase-related protein [Gammaproteobacteria bacterium]
MTYTTIDYTVTGRVLTLTLNRPERLNAFTVTMADELEHAFRRASTDDQVGTIVVTGAGRAFCAGMDLAATGNVFGLDAALRPTLADMHKRLDDPAILRGVRDTGGRVVLAIYDCMKPVIGAINGAAVGIGATMTLPMDIRLAADGAQPHPLEAHRVDSLAMWHLSQHDGAEGVRAFLEKRAPKFESKVSTDLPDFVAEWMKR